MLLTKRTEHGENIKVESNLSDSDNDARVQNSQKRKGKSSRIKPVGFKEEYFNKLRLPSCEVFMYLFSEGKKSSGELAPS